MSLRQLPNAITVARALLVLPLVWSMREEHWRSAFWIAFAAGASDALDGALAKGFGWRTRLGGLLDPLADKVLIAACFVGLWSAEAVPAWLLALILGRDAVIVAGAVAYHGLIEAVDPQPTRLSKLTTVLQIALALGWLTALAWATPAAIAGAASWIAAAHAGVAAATVLSGADYVRVWSRRAWRAHEGRRGR